MSDDFASYVIRTNFSSNWLSVRLDDDQWQSPQERTDALRVTLSESELFALEEFEKRPSLGTANSRHHVCDLRMEAEINTTTSKERRR